MRVLPFKIPKPELDALVFQEDQGLILFDKLHQHEEIQISLIVKGQGTLVVGDKVNEYKVGDILIIGSFLPHVFKSDSQINESAHMLSLFFTRQSFGEHFFDLGEIRELQLFFKRSKQGFKIMSHKKQMSQLFYELKNSSKLSRFIILLKLLQLASKASHQRLASFSYNKTFSDNDGKRIRDVFEYTMTHFQSNISLTTIAQVATMTKNAFCKYFKKRTNKTYIQFLSELRIEHACKLLRTEKELSIAEIAEESGFNNISNFNRQFKVLKGMIPSDYKNTKSS